MVRKAIILFVVFAFVLSLGGCGKNSAAAVVNGTEITMGDYEDMVELLKYNAEQWGVDFKTSEGKELLVQLKKQAIDTLITVKVLLQEADKGGFTVSEEEVNAEFDLIKSQYEKEEDFKEVLKLNRLTEETLKQRIHDELRIDRYITDTVGEIEVTEDEIREQYDFYSQQGGDGMPEYEEVKEDIKNTILDQKKGVAAIELIEELKSKSEMKIYIKGLEDIEIKNE